MEQLKQGQRIVFTIKNKNYIYTVYTKYLNIKGPFYNDQIFTDLRLNKVNFCSDCYGYNSVIGDWPESENGDYAALTRVVEALFPYCDKVIVDGNIVYSKFEKTIFKEPESSISSFNPESLIIDFESIIKSQTIKLVFI